MKSLEKELMDMKEDILKQEAPPEMEIKLKAALREKRKGFKKGAIAASIAAILIFAYAFDSMAYYGRIFTGYEKVFTDSIKQLGEEGKGQRIGKSHTFSNGTQITVDWLVFDENELVIFYTLKGDDLYRSPFFKLKGLRPMDYHQLGGHGYMEDEETWIFTQSFQSPAFYEKWMKLDIMIGSETAGISFTLDRNKAMKAVFKKDLNERVRIGEHEFIFSSISASMLSSVVEGKVLGPQMPEATSIAFDLLIDNHKVSLYGGFSSSNGNVTFTAKGEGIPADSDFVTVENIRTEEVRLLSYERKITPGERDISISDDIKISEIFYQDDGNTYVRVLSKGIPILGLFEDARQLECLNYSMYETDEAGIEPISRLYAFKGQPDNAILKIKGLKYIQRSNHTFIID